MKLEYKEHIIKKNDYVRTINGQIDRIKRILEGEDYKGSFLEIEHYSGILDLYRCPMISIYPVKYKNNSKNIIDLIEVGDYVNGDLVIEKYQRPYDGKWVVDCGDVRYINSKIEAILTHEQYEQNCYKLEE